MYSLIDFLERNYAAKTLYPKQPDVFRAFRMTQFKNTRVVIIGQDPYSDGRATGLAFANEDDRALIQGDFSPSLKKIQTCIEQLVYKGLNLDFDPSLVSWANQGVLLLNSALTVEKGVVGGHTKYWNTFLREMLKTLSDTKTGVCYLFLGSQANVLSRYVNEKSNYVFKFHHPAFSARINQPWNCPYFNAINDIIEKQNGKEFRIKW